jgi:DNA replication and repair protein RecF
VQAGRAPRLWIAHISVTDFRNFAAAEINAGPEPVVLTGPNGSGKTNLLEAISLLAPGHGLRRAAYEQLARKAGSGDWAVAGVVYGPDGPVQIGTGLRADARRHQSRPGRIVRVDGEPKSGPGALAGHAEIVWLTPAMDGLFMGPAGERRRFLDRLIACFDAGYAGRLARFERAMRQRNRLLADGVHEHVRLESLEVQMAEIGVAIAASRTEAVAALAATIAERRARDPASPFPWVLLDLEGTVESDLAHRPAVDVEDAYRQVLERARERDRAAGRALEGPHRTDLSVSHGPKAMPARFCSTGEQKALLMGLVLAHAELIAERRGRTAPILLLDEVAAHLDGLRRAALFAEILRFGVQAWMTGTDLRVFQPIADRALFAHVEEGRVAVSG